MAALASNITHETKSTAERPGSEPKNCEGTASWLIANQDIRLATNRSNPSLRLESSDIGRHPFGLDRSRPGFSRTTSATLRYGRGKSLFTDGRIHNKNNKFS